MKTVKTINGHAYTLMNGITFNKFCEKVKGFDFYHYDRQVFRWQLFWNGIDPDDLISGRTKYKLRKRIK